VARPPKFVDVLEKVRAAARTGAYRPTLHAIQRMKEREVDLTEVDYVLKNGHNCKKHDKWKDEFQCWTYGICGKTFDGKKVRLAVAFSGKKMIVTVINEELKDGQEF